LPYIVVGLVLWLAVLKSGLHATLAGVLLAMAVPLRGAVAPETFLARLTGLVGTSDRESAGGLAPDSLLHRARAACDDAEAPLVRWEHAIQPTVLFFIVPVFALANAGVALGSQVVENGWAGSTGAVTRGVALGLFVGKPLGVTAFAWLAVRLGVAELPEQLDWRKLHASSWLAGIGFTMSLFISGLALTGPALEAAKQGLLIGSGLAAVLGTALVWKACAPNASRGLVSTPPTQTEGGVRSF
jgi:NhaA family Na+:H+ antiporter